jgi:microcystin-dependent protein
MSDPFVAEIRMFAGNFAPTGWALCNGQLLPISQNTALFSLVGTYYGGDGKSTFALPDLQGMTPIQQGQGSGLSDCFLGETSGVENVTLIESEIPFHTHSAQGNFNAGDVFTPGPTVVLTNSSPGNAYVTGTASLTPMSFSAISVAGSSFPHNNMMPYLTVTFIIAMQGVFPPRG